MLSITNNNKLHDKREAKLHLPFTLTHKMLLVGTGIYNIGINELGKYMTGALWFTQIIFFM